MKRSAICGTALAAVLFITAQCPADTIYLKNGSQIEGIITRETDDSVYIEMPGGNMSLTKNQIKSIQRSPAEQAEKIQEKWEQDRKMKEREEATRAQFADQQRAKGLVQYKETWITPEKRAEIKAMEEKAAKSDAQDGQLEELKKEVDSLKGENSELRQEITRLKSQVDQHAQEQINLSREMLQQQKESLQFQKESEKRALGQRPPHIWTAPNLNDFTPYPTPAQ